MDSPLIESLNTLYIKISLSNANDAPLQLDRGLNGTVGGAAVTPLSFKGLELSDESPPFKWEWFSEPLDCSPDEKCSPESMVGTMSPLGGNPRPFHGRPKIILEKIILTE
jgi:hypothetical protein